MLFFFWFLLYFLVGLKNNIIIKYGPHNAVSTATWNMFQNASKINGIDYFVESCGLTKVNQGDSITLLNENDKFVEKRPSYQINGMHSQ